MHLKIPVSVGEAAEQPAAAGELTAADLAAADDLVTGLARAEPPGCRLPLLAQLLQRADTPEAVTVRCLIDRPPCKMSGHVPCHIALPEMEPYSFSKAHLLCHLQ